jgi:Ni,Fe-hydrogenase III small subunit
VQTVLGGGSLQAPGGDAGSDGQGAGQKQQSSRKIPEIQEDGHSDTTQVLADKEKIVKTVGDKKSFYRQDEEKVHIRFGEQDEKADILMEDGKLKVQFKDKKAVITLTEEDLTVQFGEDENAKMVMTDEDITITQGGEDASKIFMTDHEIVVSQGEDASRVTIQEDYVEVKGAAECSVGVDGRWVYINQGRVNLGVSGPKEMAQMRVMTEAGPSNRVWANIA